MSRDRSHVRSAQRALEVLDAQHARTVARLVQIADRIESVVSEGRRDSST